MSTQFRYQPILNIGSSYASGLEAQSLNEQIRDVERSFAGAESLHGQVVREFEDLFLDCREANWDGYDAEPVSNEAFVRADNFLRECLKSFPPPSPSVIPSGSLTFEWVVSHNRRFMVSVGKGDKISYAGLSGSDTLHGTAVFISKLPSEVNGYLRNLYFA